MNTIRFSRSRFRSLFSAALLLVVPAAWGTNFTVNSLGDTQPTLGGAGSGTSGDLRYCITQANYGAGGSTHTITFAVTGKITLAGRELVVNSNTTITGPGAASLTVDGNLASRVFYIAPNHTVSISGLTLVKGTGKGNDATGIDPGGYGIDGAGGAILNDRSTLTVSTCTISGCAPALYNSLSGGAIHNRARDGNATLNVTNCTITGNSATDYNGGGGGIDNYASSTSTATLNVTDTTVSNNTTGGEGGGIRNYGLGGGAPAVATITRCTISGNSAAGYDGGGGIFCDGTSGGGSASMTVSDSVISGNSLTGNSRAGGAGILNGSGGFGYTTLTLRNCTVTGNTSNKVGGGVSNFGWITTATLTISNCTINGNTAGTSGAGIYNFGSQNTGTLKVNNCTIAGNAAAQRGGGIFNTAEDLTGSNAVVVVTNSTIVGNSALSGGAGIANDKTSGSSAAASVTLGNTILALNPTGANYNTAYGSATSTGFNLSDDATCQAFLTATGDKNSTAAGLQVDGLGKPLLQNNGGTTKTVALLTGSAAIDAGKAATDPVTSLPATTDQRLFTRTIEVPSVVNAAGGDGTDIGAFELAVPVLSLTASPAGYGTVGGGGAQLPGASVTVSAVPNSGYVFVNWTEGGTPVSTSANYTFNVTANRTLVANFRVAIAQTIKVDQTTSSPVHLISGTSTVDFGGVLMGGNSVVQTFTIYNTGDSNLTLSPISVTGANGGDFTLSSQPVGPVAGIGSTTFTVSFAPGNPGVRNAVLHIPSNDLLNTPFDIFLTGTGAVQAQITSPVAGTAFTSTNVNFAWDTGTGVTNYTLLVGSTARGYDIYSGNEGTNQSRTVTLPDDGRPLYVTLYSLIGGTYQSNAYTFTAYRTPPPVKAQITSPVNGSTLLSTSLPLAWNAGVGVTSYYLFVGTSAGGYDVYAGDQGTGLSKTVNVPADKKVYVTLWSLIKGSYQGSNYIFNPVPAIRASLASPASGSTITGNQLNLTWNAGTGVSGYYIFVGSAYGGYDLGAVNAGTATAWNLPVPQDGGPIYVTLYSLINGGYQAENYWFNTALPVSGSRQARITSPANTSTLSSTMMDLAWDQGSGVTSYALWVGSTPNGYDLYSGLEGTNLSKNVTVPGDGRRVHVTLHSLISGAYQSNSYWFTAPTLPDGGAAQVTSPVNGSTLADATLPLVWSSAAGATQYYIFSGSTPGGYDLYSGSQGTTLNRTLSGMPVDGRAIYVTLYSWLNGAWKQSTAWFTTANTASGNRRALITSPANGTTLPGASTTFNWGGGVGATSYALWIGSSAGAYDLWSSAETLATTSRTVTLPTDGRKLYVTLYSFIGGAWQGASYLYTASSVAVTKAAMTSPASGSTFTGASQTFSWSASNAATMNALWIGRTPGGYDIYAGAEGTNTSRTVTTLPTDGSPVYVTLYSLIKGTWQSNEYIYNAALPP